MVLFASLLSSSPTLRVQALVSRGRTMRTTALRAAPATLYDTPVSNNGARCRIILYRKELTPTEVTIASPADLGGLNSDAYRAINPQMKMPAYQDQHVTLAESDTIARYLLSKFPSHGPSFEPDHAISNLLCRFHDMYITPIQGCLYKPTPPFGSFGTRSKALNELVKQWGIIDSYLDDKSSPYLFGDKVSLADATLFPTAVFMNFMFPKFDALVQGPALPTKLEAWFRRVRFQDPAFAKVYTEITTVLENNWQDERKRWNSIWGAGLRDNDLATVFDKIVTGEIPSSKVYEDEDVLAFQDINPVAPVHILVIPKQRCNLSSLRKSSPEHIEILGKLLVVAGSLAGDPALGFNDGARYIINDGPDGRQEVPHLHIHVLGGKKLAVPMA
jgi:diadenosine tetraphosphate (Ap4A) HIT family hydrolase/glutathione S-transferase